MTKRDSKLIGQAIGEANISGEARKKVVASMVRVLLTDNPRFNVDSFRRAVIFNMTGKDSTRKGGFCESQTLLL